MTRADQLTVAHLISFLAARGDLFTLDTGEKPTPEQRAWLDQRCRQLLVFRQPPWQNGLAERLIGSIRRECLDHIIVLGEVHLRRILKSYARYYNGTRTHLSLNKDAPISRAAEKAGRMICRPILVDCTINMAGYDLR